jgi:chromosome segregation protein
VTALVSDPLVPLDPGSASEMPGVIGDRQLVCAQTFDIARLTSHPVMIRPGSFVAVTGRGPRGDSNESGKTSYLAAVALLLGDPEWRVTGAGVAATAQLLFEPDTAGVAATRYPAATLGYVVGVFADPDQIAATAHTIWMQISATSPYLQIRHAPGVHLVIAETDLERHRQAPSKFRSLPGPDLGAHTYIERLYGRSPRCLAYVAARGKRRSGPSLLKMDAGVFSPTDIGDALILLTGRASVVESDQEERRKLAEAQEKLATTRRDHDEAWHREEETLGEIETRRQVREYLARAREQWRLHYARGLLDVLQRRRSLHQQREGARQHHSDYEDERERLALALAALKDTTALDQQVRVVWEAWQEKLQRLEHVKAKENEIGGQLKALRSQIAEVEEQAAGHSGATVVEAELLAERLRGELGDAEAAQRATKAKADEVRQALRDAEAGRYGEVGRAVTKLRDAGIEAVGLLDATEVKEDTRNIWEPRLALYRDAVCVTGDPGPALTALTDLPGAVLVVGESIADDSATALPAGLRAAPPAALAFLHALADRALFAGTPPHITDHDLGVHVVGGFPEPISGKQALLRRLTAELQSNEEAADRLDKSVALLRMQEEAAREDLVRALASQRLTGLRGQVRSLEEERLATSKQVGQLTEPAEEAESFYQSLYFRQQNHVVQIRLAETEVFRADEQLREARKAVDTLQNQLDALNIDYWHGAWGGTEQSARAALNWGDDAGEAGTGVSPGTDGARPPQMRLDPDKDIERRAEVTLRKHAGQSLDRALMTLKVDLSDGTGAPTVELGEAVRVRAQQTDEAGQPLFVDAASFVRPADELAVWLDQFADRDDVAAERIAQARQRRAIERSFAEDNVARLNEGLSNMQDSIEQRLETSLSAISEALNKLNESADGFGADLTWHVTRPQSADGTWSWAVTPRWRRSRDGSLLPYDNVTNSAQEKLFSVHLVLAALLASPNPRGRVLILDELGDSLGVEHRRDVLSAVAATAERYGITVLGTCQDGVMPDAHAYCGEILYFRYPAKSEALNRPTRMFAFDPNRERIELTADALLAGRPWGWE